MNSSDSTQIHLAPQKSLGCVQRSDHFYRVHGVPKDEAPNLRSVVGLGLLVLLFGENDSGVRGCAHVCVYDHADVRGYVRGCDHADVREYARGCVRACVYDRACADVRGYVRVLVG